MWIVPWMKLDSKKGVDRVIVFMYESGLWETEEDGEETRLEPDFLRDEYLEPNGLLLADDCFWSPCGKIWFPEISQKTDLADFYFQKDAPAEDVLRWKTFFWTKEELGVNQFHKRIQLSQSGMTLYDFLETINKRHAL